jgi:DNA-binding NtrC family response regulator
MQPETSVAVLVVSPFDDDHASLRRIFSDPTWTLHSARTCQQAWSLLHQLPIHVVVTDTEFPDGLSWKDLLEEIEGMREAQPVIVISRIADGRLWAEVLHLGGYDLLMKPLDASEVLRVVTLASQHGRTGLVRNVTTPQSGMSVAVA